MGEPGGWRQLYHDSCPANGKVECKRCGTTRQRHVQLAGQKCPVRGLFRGGEEVLEGTVVYAAWTAAVKAMHEHGRRAAAEGREKRLPPPSTEAVVVIRRPEVAVQPASLSLRSFRSHVVVRTVEVEFCMC